MKKNSENGNGRLFTEDSSQTEVFEKDQNESLRRVLQRAINCENAPESLEHLIREKIRR